MSEPTVHFWERHYWGLYPLEWAFILGTVALLVSFEQCAFGPSRQRGESATTAIEAS